MKNIDFDKLFKWVLEAILLGWLVVMGAKFIQYSWTQPWQSWKGWW